MDNNPAPTITPTVVNLGSATPPMPTGKKFGGWKVFFLIGGFLVLAIGLGIGTWLVQRQQSQNPQSKAAGCDMRWYADPNSACGQATQQPKENATDVSLTPNFHWDYGGYRSGETGCVQPSGCSSYGAIVYLAKGAYSDSSIIASCNLGTSSSSPVKDAPWSCFNHGPLEPNTDYSWVVTPFFDGTVHAEQAWKSHFKTGVNTTAACQRVSSEPSDLSQIKVNDTITFTGYGVTNAETEVIDKINFIISNDGVEIPGENTEAVASRDTTKDTEFNGKAWKATRTFKITANGSYSVRIRVHWKNQDQWKE